MESRLWIYAPITSPSQLDVLPKGTEKRPKVAGLKEVVFLLRSHGRAQIIEDFDTYIGLKISDSFCV